ncbi:cellular tumor antigen p53 isoform X2 [Folsomia candida]|nr:cellular tumor antigen p53 isoform X2 [Folsomia candida]
MAFDDFTLSQPKGAEMNGNMEFEGSQSLRINTADLFDGGFRSLIQEEGVEIARNPNSTSLVELDPNKLNLSEADGDPTLPVATASVSQDNILQQLLHGEGGEYPASYRLSQQDSFGLSSAIEGMAGAIPDHEIASTAAATTETGPEGPMGNENICFEQYGGPFGFGIVPNHAGKKVKCIYSDTYNKFYCDLGTFEFVIKLDFNSITNLEKYCIRFSLIYTDPEYQNKPVLKCINCAETQKKLISEQDQLNKSLHHIVRGNSDDKNVTYFTSERTGFCYGMIGLRHPEPGVTSIIQKLAFTCRSSCRSSEDFGINRRPTALVFTLFDHRRVVRGRSMINLRICSAPFRDYKNECCGPSATIPHTKKRKHVPENATLQPKMKMSAPSTSTRQDKCAPSTSSNRHVGGQLPGFSMEKVVKSTGMNNTHDSSSQESLYELDDEDLSGSQRRTIKMRKLARDCRNVLSWLHCDDPIQRAAAVQVFESLKFTERIVNTSHKTIKKVMEKKMEKGE